MRPFSRETAIAAFMGGLAALLIPGCTTMSGPQMDPYQQMARMLPDQVGGWAPTEPDGFYDADSLFDYIDGGAEVFRSFNVQHIVGRRFGRAGKPDIFADIYEMHSSADAFGAYHHDIREGEPAGCGQESERFGGAISFWKSRWYISIIPFDNTPETVAAVNAIAANIDRAIQEEGPPPRLLSLLPTEGQVPGSTRYFHNHYCLNAYYFVADDNLLNLDASTEGALAHYQEGDGPRITLAVTRYPTAGQAGAAYASFRESYLPEADSEGISCLEDGAWAGARLAGDHIALVFDAPSHDLATEMMATMLDRISHQPPED